MSLQFDRIEKSFGAIKALRGVSFTVAAGEAHALVGENGAGKSTLLKILAGLVSADGGDIRWQGESFAPSGPREAIERGIGMVYQEMLCLPNLSVSANIFCGREITSRGPSQRLAQQDAADDYGRRDQQHQQEPQCAPAGEVQGQAAALAGDDGAGILAAEVKTPVPVVRIAPLLLVDFLLARVVLVELAHGW